MKEEIKILGIGLMWSAMFVMVLTFYTAYRNESKTNCIDINYYGEADFEGFILVPITYLFGTMALIIIVKDYSDEIKRCQMKKLQTCLE